MRYLLFAALFLLSCSKNPTTPETTPPDQNEYENTNWKIHGVTAMVTTISNSGKQTFENTITDSAAIAILDTTTSVLNPLYGFEFKTEDTLCMLTNIYDSLWTRYELNDSMSEIKIKLIIDTTFYFVSKINKVNDSEFELSRPAIEVAYYSGGGSMLVEGRTYSEIYQCDSVINAIESLFPSTSYDSISYEIHKEVYLKK